MFTTQYMFLLIVDVFGYMAVSAVQKALGRFERETNMRNKPVIKAANIAFRQLLADQGDQITTKSVFSNTSDAFGESWRKEIMTDPRYNPRFDRGTKRGHPILSDKDREDIFMAYVDSLSNVPSGPGIIDTVVEENVHEEKENPSGGGFEGPH